MKNVKFIHKGRDVIMPEIKSTESTTWNDIIPGLTQETLIEKAYNGQIILYVNDLLHKSNFDVTANMPNFVENLSYFCKQVARAALSTDTNSVFYYMFYAVEQLPKRYYDQHNIIKYIGKRVDVTEVSDFSKGICAEITGDLQLTLTPYMLLQVAEQIKEKVSTACEQYNI